MHLHVLMNDSESFFNFSFYTGQYVNTNITQTNRSRPFSCTSYLCDSARPYILHTIDNHLIANARVSELNEIYEENSYEFYGNYTCYVKLQNGHLFNGKTKSLNQSCMYICEIYYENP